VEVVVDAGLVTTTVEAAVEVGGAVVVVASAVEEVAAVGVDFAVVAGLAVEVDFAVVVGLAVEVDLSVVGALLLLWPFALELLWDTHPRRTAAQQNFFLSVDQLGAEEFDMMYPASQSNGDFCLSALSNGLSASSR